jgi:ABC-type transport system involved in cytochrome bd biosynthesis fused ATPase/permease subunit
VFVPQKSIFEHLRGWIAVGFFSFMVALVMLVLSIGGLFLSMRAMRERQTGKASHQRIEQEEKSRFSANEPVTASAVALLKKDIESLEEREKVDSSAIQNEDDRLDGFAEFYSALMVGTVVSLISIAATITGIAFKYRKDSLQAGVSANDFK